MRSKTIEKGNMLTYMHQKLKSKEPEKSMNTTKNKPVDHIIAAIILFFPHEDFSVPLIELNLGPIKFNN